MKLSFMFILTAFILMGCSNSAEKASYDKEYQKQAAEKSDQQLTQEVKDL